MTHLLIYTDKDSSRLRYVFDLLFTNLMGLTYELTHDKEFYKSSTLPKLAYAKERVSDALFFQSVNLLFENNIHHQPMMYCEHNELKGFYPTPGDSDLPFDLFASAFFMVTRYEEYLPSKKDKYDRFRGSKSLIVKSGFLEKPMINIYAKYLKGLLLARYPSLVFVKHEFRYLPTFDIDMAYAFLHKSVKRTVGGAFRDFFFSDFRQVIFRINVMLGKAKDPFDTYDYIFKILNRHHLPSIFFFLLGDETRFDKNTSPDSPAYKKLIKEISDKTEVGIHLSYKSHALSEIESKEIDRLEDITGKKVVRNRYHYLRFHTNTSYTRLAEKGISEDYTMGYAARPGFRAGICTPYQQFSLKTNSVMPLTIYPLAFMDTTYVHYNRLNAEEAMERILKLMNNVKEVDGLLIGLWHNSSLNNHREWKGWTDVFEAVAREASTMMNTHAEHKVL